MRGTLQWFGTVSLAALLRFELPVEWVAVSWAAMAVGLYALARFLRNATFRATVLRDDAALRGALRVR